MLANNGIAISMDGKGAWRDNVFVERLWRSVKYEEVYLRACETVGQARASIGRYLDFYNGRPNPGRGSTYRGGDSVQTTGASSDVGHQPDVPDAVWRVRSLR